ncbi:MAG: C40 family peptidase [Neisseriaceae bacterium]|nr:C40 family peptidase [Neisseriaceae bacterium]
MNLSRFCTRFSHRLASAVLIAAAMFAVPSMAAAKSTTPLTSSTAQSVSTTAHHANTLQTPEHINSENANPNVVKTANRKKRKTTKKQPAVRPIAPPARTVQAHEYSEDETNNLAAYNKEKADDLLMSAMALLGISYRWGGTKPATGLDCSGFIQYVFRQAWGVNLPRTSSEMAKVGIPVNRGDLQPGDLVFFSRFGRRVGHVGMYIGDDKFIHSPSTGKKIQIADLNKSYYAKHYVGARRISARN